MKRPKINEKEAGVGPFFFKKIVIFIFVLIEKENKESLGKANIDSILKKFLIKHP